MPCRTPLPRRPTPRALALSLALGLLAVAVPAAAALYKWTDASGRVVYSDLPPPGDIKAEIVRPPAPPANPNAAKDNANRDAELKQRQSQRVEQEKKAGKARTDAAKKEEACAQARSRLRGLESDLPIYRINEKGEQVQVDDATRKADRERLQLQLRELCSG
ncbi:MAG: DUF4124 domain-containing protein [Betaproteobacteria bacterium]